MLNAQCSMSAASSLRRSTSAVLSDFGFRISPLVVFLLLALSSFALNAAEVPPPAPFGPVPTERQLRWHEMEFYGFVHFTVNTFKDQEWGYGDEPEPIFNPTDFSADQIAETAKTAGMEG